MPLLDRAIAATLPYIPRTLVHRVAQRYIAGETVEEALRVASELNRKGFRATIDILGEHIETRAEAERAAAEYLEVLEAIHARAIDSTVSLKPTQFGLKLDSQVCRDLTAGVVGRAMALGNFVRLDMEDSSCTTEILELFRSLRHDYSNVGVAIQAYLYRTLDDVKSMENLQPNYRLCKGVYNEPPAVAFKDMSQIDTNYLAALERMLRSGSYVGIATHDDAIVAEAQKHIAKLKLTTASYEFQMLLGVKERLRDRLRAEGHPVRIYIPFGPEWYAYSVRRLRENPRLAGQVLRALVSGQ